MTPDRQLEPGLNRFKAEVWHDGDTWNRAPRPDSLARTRSPPGPRSSARARAQGRRRAGRRRALRAGPPRLRPTSTAGASTPVYAGISTSPGSPARGRFLRSRGLSTRNCRSFNATRPACTPCQYSSRSPSRRPCSFGPATCSALICRTASMVARPITSITSSMARSPFSRLGSSRASPGSDGKAPTQPGPCRDDHLATDAAAGLEPQALDAMVDPDDRDRAAATPDRLRHPARRRNRGRSARASPMNARCRSTAPERHTPRPTPTDARAPPPHASPRSTLTTLTVGFFVPSETLSGLFAGGGKRRAAGEAAKRTWATVGRTTGLRPVTDLR